MSNGIVFKGVEFKSVVDMMNQRGVNKGGRVQQFVDSECIRLADKFVPSDNGVLRGSAVANTVIGSGQIKYSTPYARRWYYEAANFQGAPRRGNHWFDRMKQANAKAILSGAAKVAGGKI